MKKWNKLIAAVCIASIFLAIPGINVLADEMPEVGESIVSDASTEEVVGEQRIQVGDGVTATFDAETGAVEFYSDGGTLWQDWYIENGFDIDLIKSIKVSSGTVYLPKVSSYIFGGLYDGADAEYCTLSNLQEIDMSGFNTSNVEYMISMFEGCSSLTSLDLRSFDTSNVTNMSDMFFRCKNLKSVNLSSFNTSNVTTMGGMFKECNSLTSLDVSSFNTSNVDIMAQMFNGCSSLTTLDLSTFNTANVESMNWMFVDCSSLTSVDLSSFNTSKVTDMGAMFSGCSSLANVDLSKFDTSNVEAMHSLFNECTALTNVNLSGFNTSNVTSMHYMFNGCSSLKTLDLSSFDTSNVIEIDNMFDNCSALQILKTPKKNEINVALPLIMIDDEGNEYEELPALSESIVLKRKEPDKIQVGDGVTATFDAETGAVEFYSDEGTLWNDWFDKMGLTVDAVKSIKVSSGTVYLPQDSSFIFGGKRYDESFSDPYPNLEEIDLSNFDTSHVTDMSYMFYGCSNLTTLDLSGFDTSNVENMESMFDACSSLTSLDLSNFKTSNVQYMNSMFCLCSSLTSLVINSFDTANVVYMNDMFYGCNSLTSLDLSSFTTSHVKNVWDMFYNCSGLTSLDVSGFNTSSLEVMNGMFTNCSNLTSLDLSGFNTSKVWTMDYLFSGCSSLTSLNLTGFDTSNAEYIRYMFSDCSSLTSLDVSGFNTSKVVFMSYMFSGCRNLKTLDLSRFDTSKVQYMYGLFSGCSSLTTLDLSSFETLLYYEDEEIDDIFKDCANLHLLKTPKLNRDAIELPVTMFDDKGNEYTEIPASLKSTVLTRNKVNFFDVMDQTHPYYKAIYWAAEKKITGGYKDGTFGIDTPCTRGHAVMFLWKMAGAPAPAAVSRTPFPDVPKDHPYYKAVLWAQQNGITKGYTTGVNKGKFGVDDTCTRGQIMTFIWNFKNKPAPKTVSKSPFSDVQKTHPYYKAILWGSQNGVTKGYSTGPNAGKFGINDNCTRGQIVKFLYNIR